MKDAGVAIDAVVDIDVPDGEIIKRMSGRRVHLASGRTYHVIFNPPKAEGKDDVTGEPLIQREDDQEETVRKRLEVYHAQTEPLIGYYRNWEATGEAAAPKYIRIEGVGKVDQIRDSIFEAPGQIVIEASTDQPASRHLPAAGSWLPARLLLKVPALWLGSGKTSGNCLTCSH